MPEEKQRVVVGALKIRPEERDASGPVLARPEANYRDVIDSNDDPGVPLGAEVSFEADLTEAEVAAFLDAHNCRYVQPVVYATTDEVGPVELVEGATIAQTGSWRPPKRTMAYMDADGLEEEGWDGTGVTVAVLDGGTTKALKDLFGWEIVASWDFVSNGPARGMRNEHGCFVTPEAVPIAAKLIECVVFNEEGRSSATNTARAVKFAVDNGADVINFSGSGDSPSSVYDDARRYAARHGVAWTASAGNENEYRVGYPAAYPDVISSIAADETVDQRGKFSNYHEDANGMTPGVRCESFNREARIINWNGTSSSAPKKARVIAMGATKGNGKPGYAPLKVAASLRNTARNTPEPTQEEGAGAWRLRYALDKLAGSAPVPEPTPAPEPKPEPTPTPRPPRQTVPWWRQMLRRRG
ncbi:S8 family serine peptidase [Rubrobacter marinus]|uniref:S8 family serine peptidase n=1 Tax=Rubrobacter marinus TaxID=2653852 RepID=A0A6G8PZH5_9ACTN|nr:S8 family serine peptidase [Rubrobacter marinus]QIN79580.1 S8 family serine peptidase [Rubrobacter marinus]